MNRTKTPTLVRTWTAAFLASTVMAATTLTGGIAHAQDKAGDAAPSQGVARQAGDPPPRTVFVEVSPRARRSMPDWQEGEPLPAGYHPVQRVRKGAVVGGAVMFGVLYFISVLTAAVGADEANNNHTSNAVAGLYIPAVGPFIAMTQSPSAVGSVFLALDGLGQVGGAALLIYGITSPQTVLARDESGRPRLLPQPMLLGRSGGGLGLVGTF